MIMRYLIIMACTVLSLPNAAEPTTWTFEADDVDAIAKGFSSEVGLWKIVKTAEGKALAQTAKSEKPVFNVAFVDAISVKDVDLSVKLKSVAGEIDQGGGLVWRAKDSKNYYIARFNPLEDNFRLYKVVDGQRTMFADVDIKHNNTWLNLRVTMKGDQIACYLEGKKLIEFTDATFPSAGKIGLWSKADAQTLFDDLTFIQN